MADLYFFPVNPAEWLAGEATSAMTSAQEGAFFRLLCRQWMAKDTPCSLPNDDVRLAQLSRLGDDWLTVGAFVRAQFEEVKGDPTRIRNPKLWSVWREAQRQHRKRVVAGQHGGQAKAANRRRRQVEEGQQDRRPSIAIAMLAQSSSNAVAMSSNKKLELEVELETKESGAYPADFEMLWRLYPKRAGANKKQTHRLVTGHLKAGIDFDAIHDGTLRYVAYVTHRGWLGTDSVKTPQVFYGRDQHFLLEWEQSDIPKRPASPAPASGLKSGTVVAW